MENIKLFATFEFIALLVWVIAWGMDVNKRYNYHSTDGGRTTYHNYDGATREQAYRLSYLAAVIAILGVLVFIWF